MCIQLLQEKGFYFVQFGVYERRLITHCLTKKRLVQFGVPKRRLITHCFFSEIQDISKLCFTCLYSESKAILSKHFF